MVGLITVAALATDWLAWWGPPLALGFVAAVASARMGPAAAGARVAEAPEASPALQEAVAAALQAEGWHVVSEAAGEPVAFRTE